MVALLTLDPEKLTDLKNSQNLGNLGQQDLIEHPKIEAHVRKEVSTINKDLASFETVKRYKILDHEFSIEGGQLTPSLKMKRKWIDQTYKKDIDSLYL